MKRKCLIVIIVLAVIIIAGFIVYHREPEQSIEPPRIETADAASGIAEENVSDSVAEITAFVDFDALWEDNSDVCAWLEIEAMGISAPVMNREGSNDYYLHRDSNSIPTSAGSYFIEDYNSNDFTDPVTVVYGHNMRSGAMFGALQESFSNAKFFAENNTFTIYTPGCKYDYEVFAALPYDSAHLLYYNDFSQNEVFEKFISGIIQTRTLEANINASAVISADDRIVILSTCRDENRNERFLVIGVCRNISIQES